MYHSMSREQTEYFLLRLRLFWPRQRIAQELRCSQLSVIRWEQGDLPRYRMLKRFRVALKVLTTELIEKAEGRKPLKFYERIADALTYDEPPPSIERPLNAKGGTHDAPEVKERIRQLMEKSENGRLVSRTLYRKLYKEGFTRGQVQYACRQLGYEKRAHGAGRNSYTVWYR